MGASVHRVLQWRPIGVCERVQKAMRLRRATLPGHHFFKACSAVWDNICKTTQYEESPTVTELRKTKGGASICNKAGMCICNERGLLLQRLGNKVDTAVKKHFGMKAMASVRQKLGRAEASLLFVGQTKAQWQAGQDSGEPGKIEKFMCINVSEHSYSPWLSAYQKLHVDVPLAELAIPPAELQPKLSLAFLRKYFMLDEFDIALRWRVATYTNFDSSRMVPHFLPDRMEMALRRIEGLEDYQEVWCPWRKPGGGGGAGAGAGAAAWALALADLEEGAAAEAVEGAEESAEDAAEDGEEDPGGEEEVVDGEIDDPLRDSADEAFAEDAASAALASEESSVGSVLGLLADVIGDEGGDEADDEADADDEAEAADPGGGAAAAAAPVAAMAPAAIIRLPADTVVAVEEGIGPSTLVYYSTSGLFYAYCRRCGHGARCCKNRKSLEGRSPAAGRPLGFLYWWLLQRLQHLDGEDCGKAHRADCNPTWVQRREARDALKLVPGADQLFAAERDQRGDEPDSEPEVCP